MLKECQDGLSKAWKVDQVHAPFYSGGKVNFSLDESLIICSHDESISVVDWESGSSDTWIDSNNEGDEGAEESITAFCVHPNGSELTISTRRGLLKNYRLSDKECLRVIRGHHMPVTYMAYDSSGSFVATASADRSVRVWDIHGGFCTHSFKDHTDVVQRVMFHEIKGNLSVFSSSDDTTLRVFDLVSQKCLACFREHMSLPTSFCFNSVGSIFASVGRDKVLNFYDSQDLRFLKTVAVMEVLEGVIFLNKEHSQSFLGRSDVMRDIGRSSRQIGNVVEVVITAGETGLLRLFRVEIVEGVATTVLCTSLMVISATPATMEIKVNAEQGHGGKVWESNLLKAFRDALATTTVGLETAVTAAQQSEGDGGSYLSRSQALTGLHYLPVRGELVAVTGDNNICSFRINDEVPTGNLVPVRQLVGSNDDILDLAYVPLLEEQRPAGHLLAVVTNSPQVRLLRGMTECLPLNGHTDIVLAVDVSPDGEWLCTSSKDRTCRVWRTREQRCYALAEGHTDAVGAIGISQRISGYSSKQAFMASGAGDKILKRWALPVHVFDVMATESPSPSSSSCPVHPVLRITSTHSVRAHEKDINTVAISPNDAYVASGSQDKSIRLWQASDLSPVATLSGHKRGIWKVAFSPVDKCLVSCSGDRTLRLWSMVDFSCLRTFEGHTGSVLSVVFVNKGMQILSGSADGLVRLWTIRTGECEATLEGHDDKVWALAVPTVFSAPSSSSVAALDAGFPGRDDEGEERNNSETSEGSDEEEDGDSPASGDEKTGVEGNAAKVVSAAATTESVAAGIFFSGGSDSRLLSWRDVTQQEERSRIQALELDLVAEQQMQNDIRNKKFGKAISTALQLGHSHRTLTILTAIIEQQPEGAEDVLPQIFAPSLSVPILPPGRGEALYKTGDGDEEVATVSLPMSLRLDPHVDRLTDEEVEKIVGYLKDWNTNARHCFVSSLLIGSLIRVCGVVRLTSLRSVAESLPALISYSERHFQRMSRLYQATYLGDYLGSLMSILPDTVRTIESHAMDDETDVESSSSRVAKKKKRSMPNDSVPVIFAPFDEKSSLPGADDDELVAKQNPKNKPKKSKRDRISNDTTA